MAKESESKSFLSRVGSFLKDSVVGPAKIVAGAVGTAVGGAGAVAFGALAVVTGGPISFVGGSFSKAASACAGFGVEGAKLLGSGIKQTPAPVLVALGAAAAFGVGVLTAGVGPAIAAVSGAVAYAGGLAATGAAAIGVGLTGTTAAAVGVTTAAVGASLVVAGTKFVVEAVSEPTTASPTKTQTQQPRRSTVPIPQQPQQAWSQILAQQSQPKLQQPQQTSVPEKNPTSVPNPLSSGQRTGGGQRGAIAEILERGPKSGRERSQFGQSR